VATAFANRSFVRKSSKCFDAGETELARDKKPNQKTGPPLVTPRLSGNLQ